MKEGQGSTQKRLKEESEKRVGEIKLKEHGSKLVTKESLIDLGSKVRDANPFTTI
jgi:hypothetical protein